MDNELEYLKSRLVTIARVRLTLVLTVKSLPYLLDDDPTKLLFALKLSLYKTPPEAFKGDF